MLCDLSEIRYSSTHGQRNGRGGIGEDIMNASQIKTMNGTECFNEIVRIEGKARMNGKKLTKAEEKTIKLLEKRIDEVNPDRED